MPIHLVEGVARIVTFANGTVARELRVDCDDARRRLVYAVVIAPYIEGQMDQAALAMQKALGRNAA